MSSVSHTWLSVVCLTGDTGLDKVIMCWHSKSEVSVPYTEPIIACCSIRLV